MKKTLTVFTPTYNRAYCLHLLYESLLRQTSPDFEWLVVDDGSSDDTRQLVQRWKAENKVVINYVYKENGGMHTGHNTAYSIIDTKLNVCIDSDDWLPDNGVEKIVGLWNEHGSDRYAGIIGLDEFANNGKIVGNKFPDDLQECLYSELKPKYGVWGDKKIIFRTDVVRQLAPYPVFPAERFVPLYYPIVVDQQYKLLVFNEVFCIVDYQTDGSTLNIYDQYFRHPKGFSYSRTIEMQNLPTFIMRFKSAMHYIATSVISRNWSFVGQSPKPFLTLLALPFGLMLYFFLLTRKNKKRDISKYLKKEE
ncbi:MAG TPA: glycosyltransferase family A protein [Flavobacterium sp.]|jgi:glycosyltransferase involved in cell wall biosynthesis